MSLRRSPRRTSAFLATNSANAQRSTGLCTALGKQRSAVARRRCDLNWIPAVGAIRIPEARRARVHMITRVTCTGHPPFNRGPEGVPLSTKPGTPGPENTNEPGITQKRQGLQEYRSQCGLLMGPAPRTARKETYGNKAAAVQVQGADDSAPPWELPEGCRMDGGKTEGFVLL